MFKEIFLLWTGIKISEWILQLAILGIAVLIVLVKKVIEDIKDKKRRH